MNALWMNFIVNFHVTKYSSHLLPFFAFNARWVPESSRWLIARGNLDQAKMYLTRCASMNRKERPIPTLTNEVCERCKCLKFDLLCTLLLTSNALLVLVRRCQRLLWQRKKIKLIRISIWSEHLRWGNWPLKPVCCGLYFWRYIMSTLWRTLSCDRVLTYSFSFTLSRLCIATTFYGISFNLTGFGLDIYLAQFSYAAVELPAKLAVYYLLDKVGRRRVEASALLLAGVCLSINIVVPKGSQHIWLDTVYVKCLFHYIRELQIE